MRVVAGENMGTAFEVCDTLEVHSQVRPEQGCECACLLLGEAIFTEQNRVELTKRQNVCVPFPFTKAFSKTKLKATPGSEVSMQL